MRTALIILLTCCHLCYASFFLKAFDRLFGFGSGNLDVMHALNGIKSTPEWQCRQALSVKDRSTAPILLNVLPSLSELVTENEEFISELSSEEQFELLKFYIYNMSAAKPIDGKALCAVLTIIFQEYAYDLLNLALEKGLFCTKDLFIFFLKHMEMFAEAVKAGALTYLDITEPIIAGRSILHVLAEKGYTNLCKEIIDRLPNSLDEKVKYEHVTDVEGNSVLHCAVLSNNPEMISLMARHFNRLCGNVNKFGMSPLKLSLSNGNNYESVKALLDFGCVADGEDVTNSPIEIPKMNHYYDFHKELDKLSGWARVLVERFRELFQETCKSFDGPHAILDKFKFVGLVNSYRELNASLDRQLDCVLIGSPGLRRSPNSFMRFTSQNVDEVRRSTNLMELLSSETFDPAKYPMQNVFLSNVIDGMNFNFCSKETKLRVLKNLTHVKSFDYTGTTLSRFIQVLIEHSEPEVFAHFVNENIDYYFCIRSIFKLFQNYEALIPFLDAIGFRADKPFFDGLYPIHLAAQTGNLKLLSFLVQFYGAELDTLTVYEGNNILHYGLNDRNSREVVEFLFSQVPQLLDQENNFHVTPMQLVLLSTEKMETVNKLITSWQNLYTDYEFDYSDDINSAFNEVMELWPSRSEADQGSKDKFYMLFKTCGSNENARLLLAFVTKKLLKYLVDEKAPTWLLSGFKNYELRARSRSSSGQQRFLNNDSPTCVDIRLSP